MTLSDDLLKSLSDFCEDLKAKKPLRVTRMTREETPDGPLHTREKFTFFWKGTFSQWFRRPFVVDGVQYNTAEQYMMAEKARFFKDNDTLRKIMSTTSPKEQKALGREVKNFDQGEWNKVARDIVYKGNYAKFRQHKDLREELFATSGTTLCEASPEDPVWGIRLSADDPLALDRKTWKGKNWLGETLTKVREDLKKELNG